MIYGDRSGLLTARMLAPDPAAQEVTFYRRADGVEAVRVASKHDRSVVVDRAADDCDRQRWAAEYATWRANPR